MTIRRVIKIGGSCLMGTDLAGRLTKWLSQQPVAQNLMIVGGGQAIDAMRTLASLHTLDEPAMHWRCVEMLRATAEIVAELVPQCTLCSTPAATQACLSHVAQPGDWLLAVDTFYTRYSSADSGLPEGWATTTDAIAAYLTRIASAQELVLLKSCEVPAMATPQQLADQGIVDSAFPQALPNHVQLRIERLPIESVSY